MATYKEIQSAVKEKYGISLKTCWIADVKERNGIITKVAPNRISSDSKVYPCPEKYVVMIEEAMRTFKMIN